MHACWKILAAALCAAMTITAVNAAEITLSSPADFTEISLNIKDTYNANPDLITLEATLSQDAQQRMAAASSAALGQDLTLLINGKAISTSRVQSVLDTPQLQISMSRQAAMELLPALLGVNGRASAPAASQTATVAAVTPAPADNPLALLAAAPVMVETRQVTPPSVSTSNAEAEVMPAAQVVQDPDPAPVPATEPAAMRAADPMPLAENPEPAMASTADIAPPPLPPALPPVIPGWALGAWLPTSASPSPYAEINVGDPVTILANTVDALTCNKARLSVLESNDAQVLLQVASNSPCVISGVQVDRLQIFPTHTPGRIVISLRAQQDDMNGPPSKEGPYRRK